MSALVLTLVIGCGPTALLDAKTKVSKAPKVHHSASPKAPKAKGRRKPAKIKPMKFRKGKLSNSARASKPSKPAKGHKVKPRSV